MKKKVVVALGHRALGTTLPEQQIAVKRSAKVIADLVQEGASVAITHSNAPQVGMIHTAMNEFGKSHENYSAAPMSVCSAMSQGYIGYDLQNSIRAELLRRGIYKPVATVITQVQVDPYDDAFHHPTKVVGRYMTKEEADAEEEKGNYVVETEQGYRRIVASPKPQDIIEIDTIRLLMDAGQVVIACGGGGIPVIPQEHALKGASAVIEKDCIAGKLAGDLHADQLIILTSVKQVYKDYQKETETPIRRMNIPEARAYIQDGQFEAGTMLPKIEAAVSYLEAVPSGSVLITSLDFVGDAVRGKAGTLITA